VVAARSMAVMKGVHVGNRDVGRPCLWFETDTGSGAALQVLIGQDALDLIEKSGVYDVRELEGKTCWVEASVGMIRFIGLTGIGLRMES